jgi:hypothetical protein
MPAHRTRAEAIVVRVGLVRVRHEHAVVVSATPSLSSSKSQASPSLLAWFAFAVTSQLLTWLSRPSSSGSMSSRRDRRVRTDAPLLVAVGDERLDVAIAVTR